MEAEAYHNHNLDLKTVNLIKVSVSVVLSLCICRVSSKVVPKGLPRLLTFIPVVCLFLAHPFIPVYEPTLAVFTPIVGRMWAPLPAMLCTFTVSALMHELMLFYMGPTWPTWHVTWFFLLHGASLVVEVGVKKMLKGKCQLPPVISSLLTLGFVLATGFWLLLPQVLLSDANVRGSEQFELLSSFGKKAVGGWGYIKFNSSKL